MSIRQSDFYLVPNILSLSRVLFIPVIVLFLYWEWNIAALILFVLSGISDYVDGWIARKFKEESKLGMLLDPLADKLIILSIMIMLLWLGRLDPRVDFVGRELVGPVLVIVTVGREIGITGLRAIASTAGIVVASDQSGKLKTWIQFVSISLLILGGPLALQFGQVLLGVSVLAALWSGIGYIIRFLRGLPS